MKKIFVLILSFLTVFQLQAQFTVTAYSAPDSFDILSEFPIVSSEAKSNAAKRINQVLHAAVLEKAFSEKDEDRFSAVFPQEGEHWGAAEFEYEVISNNQTYFSIGIRCSYTGAYTEYSTRYFTFDASSGQRVLLTDMFDKTGLQALSKRVNDRIVSEIVEFVEDLDTTQEYTLDQRDIYMECLDWIDEDDLVSPGSFYLTDSTMVCVRGRCSNHMMRALDDLWDFHIADSFDSLAPIIASNGAAFVAKNPMQFNFDGVASEKILEGAIGGKYPITVILQNTYDNLYSGIYWYDNVQKKLELNGYLDAETATLHLDEYSGEKITGSMAFTVFSDGELSGTWSDASGETTFDLLLKVAE